MRRLAVETAAADPAIAAALDDKTWQANAHFDYEDSAWQVVFSDDDGDELASALVDLNKKRPSSRVERATKGQPQVVTSVEVVE
jgi:hypothetical protein